MTLFQSRHNAQYPLSQQDVLDIDKEITQTYAPQVTPLQPTQYFQSQYNPQCNLLQQDLLDISAEITQSYAPHAIPHDSELVLIPVDPLNLYAYWNLDAEVTDGLYLRVYSLPEGSEQPNDIKLTFDVKVEGLQNQQKVRLPIAAMAYSAVIGQLHPEGHLHVLATAETIHVPRVCPVPVSRRADMPRGQDPLDIDVNSVPPIEASTVQVPQEETGYKQADNIGQSEPILVNERLPKNQIEPDIIQVTRKKPIANNVDYDDEQFVQVSQTYCDTPVSDVPTENGQSTVLIMRNFNDYGYDLMVYEYGSNAAFATIVAEQTSNMQGNSKIIAISQNASGLGCH